MTHKITYSAGGYPMPTYNGKIEIWATDENVREKAMRQICREICMSPMSVKITKVERIEE